MINDLKVFGLVQNLARKNKISSKFIYLISDYDIEFFLD